MKTLFGRGAPLAGLVALAVLSACSSDSGKPRTSLDGNNINRNPTAVAPCTTGEVKECSVTLSAHEGVLNCYRGEQVCIDGTWGNCGSGEMISMPAPGEALRGSIGLRYLAITGAEACGSNPCDPSCLEIEAEEGDQTTPLTGDHGEYAWQTGALESYPSGLVKKGIVEPCSSGFDCQFNTECTYPVSTGCAHSKCATGAPLDPKCDSCVEDICEVDPTCCPQDPVEPPACAHDPCLQGAALDPTCDPCVTAVCLAQPSCCTGTWDASCRALVLTTCGNSCECAAGETAYNGACYVKEETDRSWTAARTACQARGAGWDLAAINDSAENTFLNDNVIDASETWIGFTDGNGIGTDGIWKWSSGDPSGSWDQSTAPLYGAYSVFEQGSTWKYRADVTAPPSNWSYSTYSDAAWPTGTGQFGFGDGDEVTWLSNLNPNPSYYFRKTFTLAKKPSSAQLKMLFDDGYIVYVNGVEISRNNVGTGAAHGTYATTADKENSTANVNVSFVTPFVVGANTVGVWVKNGSSTSNDLTFDMGLGVTYNSDRPIAFLGSWKYYAATAAPPAAWNTAGFVDTSWTTANAEFGFGESDQATTLSPTSLASYYFRKTFTLTDALANASLSVKYDDGFVAYINGTEVRRVNVSNTGHANFASGTADNATDTGTISTSPFVIGTNVLAFQLKNANTGTNDLSFDAQLDTQYAGPTTIYKNFGAGEPGNQACARFDANQTGTWGDKSCTEQTDAVCEGPAGVMVYGGGVPLWGSWTAVNYGSTWKYRASTTDPGSTWNSTTFNDSSWSSGAGQLGYGNGDETTTFSAANPSYYFRKVVNIPTEISDATLSVLFDDGFIVYVNGVQVATKNIGSTAHSAYATTSSSNNETWNYTIDVSPFVVGNNTIAVQVKNVSSTSSDISFDLKLDVNLCGADGCPPDPTWSDSCVALVNSVCDATCDTRDPPASTGQCIPRFPGDVDEDCNGYDLSVGVPCDDNIPVCNHGTKEAPAGIQLVHFPANAGHFPTCEPNTSHPQMKSCSTTEPIPPGECVNVKGCDVSGNREIMVNPPGAAHVDECSCRDNWGLYSGGECGEPTCDGGSNVASLKKKPVDIIIIIDNSGSMQGEIEQVQQRINEDFAQIIEESGIDYRVIMMSRYGDVNTAVGGSDYPICVSSPLGGHNCSNPIAQGVKHNPSKFYHFSVDVGSWDPLCRLIQGFTNKDELASDSRPWTSVAPTGYQALLRPEARKSFLVITDDRVDCTWGAYDFDDKNTVAGGQAVATAFDAALLTLSPTQFGTLANRNYVFHSIVAMQENSPGKNPWPATASIKTGKCTPGSENPGTGYQGLSVLTGGLRYPTCRNSDFDAIFQAVAEEVIEGAALSCSVSLEDNAQADPSKTSVRYTSGSGTSTVLTRVDDVSKCTNNAYYYENATTIALCPATCTTVQADFKGSLSVEVGCTTSGGYASKVITEKYESECNEDTTVQWSFLTYVANTPRDSSVTFKVRTAPSEAALANATWIEAAVAQSTPTDTQSCGLGGPSPCPIDLYKLLGSKAAHHKFAEVEVTLKPTSDGVDPATVQTWQLNYSCPYSQ